MAASNPTIIVGHINDQELKNSIANLVAQVKVATHTITGDFDSMINHINSGLKSIGGGGSGDAGASRRTAKQQEESQAVKATTQAYKEQQLTFDQMAQGMAKTTGKTDVLKQYDESLERLKTRLAEVRQDIDIFNYAIGSGKASQISWGQEGLRKANAEAEQLMKTITILEGQRTNLANILAPQGHSIQNFVNSLTKANPELARLNEQFKRGQSLMQNGGLEAHRLATAQGEIGASANATKERLEAMNAYIAQASQREKERQEALLRTGQAAQETSNRIIRSMQEQASINVDKPITGLEQLKRALEQMRTAYYELSKSERETPLGMALQGDIKRAEAAYIAVQKYNWELARMQQSPLRTVSNLSSLQSLRDILKDLSYRYSRLTIEEIKAGKGDALRMHFQQTTRAAEQLQATLSRPISFAAVKGLSEKTLDDIAYKMRQLSSYRSGLDVDKQKTDIQQVNAEYDRLKKKMDEVMQKSQSMVGTNNALTRSWNYMKNRLAFYVTVGAGTAFVKNLIEVRSQYEMNERALGILIDSAERGTQIFKELSQMALVSPYTLIELSTAAKQLTAYDVAAKDVVDTTRRLADMASAVGIPVERLTYALGQIKAYGYLNSRDARMFANAGIPLVKQLSEYYSELEGHMVSTADIYDRIKKKAIGYGEVMDVITKMTDEGGKFFDFQAKMADTLKVQLANLTLAWNNMLNDIGASNQGVLSGGIRALKELFLHWKDLEKMLYSVAIAYGAVKLGQILYINYTTKAGLATAAADVANKKLVASMYALNNGIKALIANPMTWWMLLATVVVSAGMAFYDAYQKVKEFNNAIRDGAEENYKNVKEYLDSAQAIRDSLYETSPKGKDVYRYATTPQDIDKNEANKAWEAMKEQIELSTAASETYISQLLQIENVSQRLREGFRILDDIQAVNAALKELSGITFDLSQGVSGWWNAYALPDSAITNIKEYTDTINDANNTWKTTLLGLASIPLPAWFAPSFLGRFESTEHALETVRKDFEATTESINNFIDAQNFKGNPTATLEIWSQALKKIVVDNQLDPQQAFTLQKITEEARSKAMREALDARIKDEKNALAAARDEESKAEIEQRIATLDMEKEVYAKNLDESRPYWDDFTKYMKERHISEVRMMFKGMNEEEIKSLNFQEGKYAEFVHRMVEGYAKSHKMSYDDAFNYLKHWVSKANLWSIFIKLNIGTEEDKTMLQMLEGYDAAIDKADAAIKRLETRENELLKKRNKTRKEEDELNKVTAERAEAQKTKAENEAKGGHGKQEERDAKAAARDAKKHASAAARSAREAESELQKTLKNELSLIEKIRSVYQSLTKEGASHTDALNASTKGFEQTIKSINEVFAKWGIKNFDAKMFAGAANPHMLVNLLQSQLNTILGTGRAKQSEIKDLEVKIQELTIDAKKYDLKKITDGLNNELSKLKDEYELAIELDANPELGDLFANMWGINTETLPHTVKEYADEYTKLVNKYLKENNAGLELPSLDLTDDDLRAFEEMVNAQTMNEEWYKVISNGVKAVRAAKKKDYEETAKEWDKLIEKYGGLQAQLLKIFKDTTKEQIGVIRKFGDDEDVKKALQLQAQINLSTDANEIARLAEQLKAIQEKIAATNPQAANLFGAIHNEQGSKSSKAYWEDFKNSELYSMTFEDMEHVSTRAIRAIITQLESLKDKVKEDPVSMKALIKSMEDAEAELITRNPFASIVSTFKEWRTAASEAREAQERLKDSNRDVANAEAQLNKAQNKGDINEIEVATLKLVAAKKKQKDATTNATKKENAAINAQKRFSDSCKAAADALDNIGSLIQQFADMMGVVEDSDADVAIQSITKALGAMSAALGFASAMVLILESEMPYLAAIAAVLTVITAAFSFLSGQKDAKITRQIKASEREVKRLENTYKNLEDTAENAYGAIVSGAQKAMQANKELQLVELQRQLTLEKSRSKKKRDKDKIIDLEGQIIELRNEIKNATQDIINDMLGISSVGDGIEGLVGSMIEAFRNGEDAMKAFGDKWDEMIDNMILKLLVSHYMQQAWDKVMADLSAQEDAMLAKYSEDKAYAQREFDRISAMTDEELAKEIAEKMGKGAEYRWMGWRPTAEMMNAYRKAAESALLSTTQTLNDASYDYTQWSLDYMNHEGRDYMMQYAQMLKDSLGEWYTYGENNEKNLSALQQGITGITEDTAGALEAYMNGVSQQVYLQSDLLTQIRDAVVLMNPDVELGVMSQVLLQLQSSYQVQMTIQNTLNGWSNPSGQAVRVELM